MDDETAALVGLPEKVLAARFPLTFVEPVVIYSSRGPNAEVVNGTATFVDLGDGPMIVTCWHVIDRYREFRANSLDAGIQVGWSNVDLDDLLIDEDKDYDLATLRVPDKPLSDIESKPRPMGLEAFMAPRWPPAQVEEGDPITFGGYPGALRAKEGDHDLMFGALTVTNADVTSAHHDRIACQFDRSDWYTVHGSGGTEFKEFGGMSGGPLFRLNELHWDFVGIIYEFSATMDVLFATPATRLEPGGSIIR